MTSPRPYRPVLTHERALLELCACAGTQFDPAITELFLDVWSDPVELLWPVAAAS
jgi:HD-GYP domain-containing protein (c-di-GMP phosphodiesterase class II)